MITINAGMCLQKTIKERLVELRNLRSQVAVEKKTEYPWMEGDKQKIDTTVVKYDIKLLDKKITEIELFLYKLDAAIKHSNAVTEISIEADVDKLLAPLE